MRSLPLTARFWLLTAAALAGIAATSSLGLWQLSRAAEKQALQDSIDSRQAQPALDGAAVARATDTASAAGILYRSARLQGTWLHRNTVFLDNRQMQGKPGFFVLTPLRLLPSGPVVLVQRGWVQRHFTDRTEVPAVPAPEGPVEVAGRIAPPPSKLYEFEASNSGVIRQNLDIADFSREIGAPLAAVSLLQTAPADDGLLRDWPRIATGIEKHYGYAFQWFALCALIACLYVWFQIVRRFFSHR